MLNGQISLTAFRLPVHHRHEDRDGGRFGKSLRHRKSLAQIPETRHYAPDIRKEFIFVCLRARRINTNLVYADLKDIDLELGAGFHDFRVENNFVKPEQMRSLFVSPK